MSPKIEIDGFSCEYDVNSKENIAKIRCVSDPIGVPYPCVLDGYGRVKKEISGSFGKISLDSKTTENKDLCVLYGFGGELTVKKGIDAVKSTIKNAVEKGLNIVL